MKWFSKCRTGEEVRKMYKELCKKYHPDCAGGSTEIMQEINAEFRIVFERLKNVKFSQDTGSYYEETDAKKMAKDTPDMFIEIVNKLFSISADIVIEICGTWLWLTGDTYSVRDQLKAIGCRWSRSHRKWYFTYDPYVHTRFTLSERERRSRYGSEFMEAEKRARLAH